MTIDIDSKKDFPYTRKYNEENRRKRVYQNIYLNERDKYPLQFSEYKIWYRDGNERNESAENILLLTDKEYEEALDEAAPWEHPESPIFEAGIKKRNVKNTRSRTKLLLIIAGVLALILATIILTKYY